MIIQTAAPHNIVSRSQRIKTQMPNFLSRRGLPLKIIHRRQIQDSGAGKAVYFGVPGNQIIATCTLPLSDDYFNPRLSRDPLKELNAWVVPSSNHSLLNKPNLETSQAYFADEKDAGHTIMHQRLSKLLEITGSNNTKNKIASNPLPDILFIDETEFNQQMTKYEPKSNLDRNP